MLKFVLSIFHKCIVSLPKRYEHCLFWLLLWASLIAQLVKNLACNAGNPSLFPGLGRSAREGIGYPLQYSGLANSTVHIVHAVANSRTRLSNFHFHFEPHISMNSHPHDIQILFSLSHIHLILKAARITQKGR